MPIIYVQAEGFAAGEVRRPGAALAPRGRLVAAAAAVGAAPLGVFAGWTAASPRRPYLELQWRVAMVMANLDDAGPYYRRSQAYDRLDPSEKSAVSYFLGMAQAALIMDYSLEIPFLAHLDAVLVASGMPQPRDSRPDFIGVRTRDRVAAAVEAKGRTRGWDQRAVEKAKEQARLLPGVTGFRPPLEIASMAYFDRAGDWCSYIADPPRERESPTYIEAGAVVIEHYRPVVEALRSAPQDALLRTREDLVLADLLDVGAQVGVPLNVWEFFEEWVPRRNSAAVLSRRQTSVSLELAYAITEAALSDTQNSIEDTADTSLSVGGSGISVTLLT